MINRVLKSAVGKHIRMVEPKLKELDIDYRIVAKNGLITYDHKADRVNIEVSKDGIVELVYYG